MLQNLHVKNLALIDEIEVEFQEGLNILTGETGAGKSIILGSVNLALGGKYQKDMIREGAEYGLSLIHIFRKGMKGWNWLNLEDKDFPNLWEFVIIIRSAEPYRRFRYE